MSKFIGRLEKIYFKNLDLKLKAKIDTGAWSSSIHVDGVEIDGDELVFWIGENKWRYKEYSEVTVKNSFGHEQQRYLIKLKIKIGIKKYNLLVTLADRKKMKYPCLIGRSFLRKYSFLVDVRKKYVNDRFKKI